MSDKKLEQPLQPSSGDLTVTVGPVQTSLPAQLYQDARPTIQNVLAPIEAATRLLRLPTALLHLPEKAWKGITGRLKTKLEGIPAERLQEPDPRLLGHVLESAKWSGEEPALQELFAQLLACASDTAAAGGVRATFADLVAQLEPLDARVLEVLASIGAPADLGRIRFAIWPDDVRSYTLGNDGPPGPTGRSESLLVCIDNLVRTGLVEVSSKPEWNDLNEMRNRISRGLDVDNWSGETVGRAIADVFEGRNREPQHALTSMGQLFCAVALPPGPEVAPDQGEPKDLQPLSEVVPPPQKKPTAPAAEKPRKF